MSSFPNMKALAEQRARAEANSGWLPPDARRTLMRRFNLAEHAMRDRDPIRSAALRDVIELFAVGAFDDPECLATFERWIGEDRAG